MHPAEVDIIKVSSFAAKVLGAAYTQRGRLLVKLSQRKGEEEDRWDGVYEDLLPDVLKGKRAGALEEMANGDFEWGGRYGCEVGREMAVRTNVYQKACGVIVGEAIRGEKMGRGG